MRENIRELHTKALGDLGLTMPVSEIGVIEMNARRQETERLGELRQELDLLLPDGRSRPAEKIEIPETEPVPAKANVPEKLLKDLKRVVLPVVISSLPIAACSLTLENVGSRFLWGLGSASVVGLLAANLVKESITEDKEDIHSVVGILAGISMFGSNMIVGQSVGVVGVIISAIVGLIVFPSRATRMISEKKEPKKE